MAWAGWGAGPAGAGSAGGPSKGFLLVATLAATGLTIFMAIDGKPAAFLTGAAAAWFAARLFGLIGPKGDT
jgi:hypothetical protein